MEKLYELIRSFIFRLFILLCAVGYAQDGYVVFKKEGNPVFKVNDTIKSIRKGTQLTPNCSVTLERNDSLLYVDKEGSCFSVDNPGTYAYSNLAAVAPVKASGSFTKRYLAYVWEEFAKRRKTKSKVGVVYRIDNVVLLQPNDSVKIYRHEITFGWSSDTEDNFFFLKDTESGHMTKIGTSGKFLKLFVDNQLLRFGRNYEWAISGERFPDLTELEFYTFELMLQEDFRKMESELEDLKKDLKSLGLTSEEIRISLCADYKFCY